jgi:hypothetical protein
MKYILMMNTMRARQGVPNWRQADLQAHIAFMKNLNRDLHESGERVSSLAGKAGPRASKDGAPITDGVFPESKEFLAGFWIVDVDTAERRMPSPQRYRRLPARAGRRATWQLRCVRYKCATTGDVVTSAAMTRPWDTNSEHPLRELAPRVLGMIARRYRDFVFAEDAVQEALLVAFMQWPQEGVPDNPFGWLIQVASRRISDQAHSEIAQRISRAKQSIKASGVRFGLPSPAERAQRLPTVLHVLYLIFNEGYASSVGMRLERLDPAREAIGLARGVKALLPEDAEVAGLLR